MNQWSKAGQCFWSHSTLAYCSNLPIFQNSGHKGPTTLTIGEYDNPVTCFWYHIKVSHPTMALSSMPDRLLTTWQCFYEVTKSIGVSHKPKNTRDIDLWGLHSPETFLIDHVLLSTINRRHLSYQKRAKSSTVEKSPPDALYG